MHERVAVGDRLQLSLPHNLFPLHSQASHHVLVAGGIGITPFMAYIAELQARGASFELHYAFRGRLTDAYVEELAERLGERLHAYDSSAGQRLDLAALLAGQPLGTHLYACGPQRLLDGLREQARALGWADSRVHWEAFAAPEPGLPFRVELARSGRHIEVPADLSLLEALEAAGVELPNLCRGGVCGQCATRYLAGAVEHRDHYLDEGQRADSLMPCVSRGSCASPLLLDL
jgi:ferredoxin-NADP reductase